MLNKKLSIGVRLILGVASIALIILSMFDDRSNTCLAAGLCLIAVANIMNCAERRKKAAGRTEEEDV